MRQLPILKTKTAIKLIKISFALFWAKPPSTNKVFESALFRSSRLTARCKRSRVCSERRDTQAGIKIIVNTNANKIPLPINAPKTFTGGKTKFPALQLLCENFVLI